MHNDWLNYHHLLYFYTVVKEGSITRACDVLHLTQPTISGQLRKLEKALGAKLYRRVGRELVLTDVGRMVFRYAEEIFSIGRELMETVRERPGGRPVRLRVGIPDVLPKLIAFRLLEPALNTSDPVQIICREGSLEQLLAQLAIHELDVVFSDSPIGSVASIRGFNHSLGQCGLGLFGTKQLCQKHQGDLPQSMLGAPFLLPAPHTAMRRSMDQWIHECELQPRIVGELDDTALAKVFAEAGVGFVPAPLAIQKEIEKQFGLQLLLEVPNATEHFYAITVERRLRHPAVVAISEAAKASLFGDD
ncbi:MAG: transcriptional activator NhaR [Pirellulaceae bacterium]|nr:transcriptional activator NhaR [Planctomycetales bacterium]